MFAATGIKSVRGAILSALVYVACFAYVSAELPDYIAKCKPSEKVCLLKNMNKIFTDKYNGDAQIGLEDLEPLTVGEFNIEGVPNGSVNIKLNFRDMSMKGSKTIKAVNVKGFGKNPEGRHDVLLTAERVDMYGDYSVDGKVIILPVQGKGKAYITLVKPQLKLTILSGKKQNGADLFLDVKNINLDLKADRIIFNFENLFNGNKDLGENVNKFVNENWKEIFEDLKPSIISELSKQLTKTIKSVFDKVPYSDLIEV